MYFLLSVLRKKNGRVDPVRGHAVGMRLLNNCGCMSVGKQRIGRRLSVVWPSIYV